MDFTRDLTDRVGQPGNLPLGLLPGSFLDRLADAGKRLHPISRVEPGRIDLVNEPGTSGQTVGMRHRPLGAKQNLVDLPGLVGGQPVVSPHEGPTGGVVRLGTGSSASGGA